MTIKRCECNELHAKRWETVLEIHQGKFGEDFKKFIDILNASDSISDAFEQLIDLATEQRKASEELKNWALFNCGVPAKQTNYGDHFE